MSRGVNIVLCIMQTVAPFMTLLFFSIATAQEPSLRMIIKGYATIGLVCRIDDIFASSIPEKLKQNMKQIYKL